jgi:hypothetical protein
MKITINAVPVEDFEPVEGERYLLFINSPESYGWTIGVWQEADHPEEFKNVTHVSEMPDEPVEPFEFRFDDIIIT